MSFICAMYIHCGDIRGIASFEMHEIRKKTAYIACEALLFSGPGKEVTFLSTP